MPRNFGAVRLITGGHPAIGAALAAPLAGGSVVWIVCSARASFAGRLAFVGLELSRRALLAVVHILVIRRERSTWAWLTCGNRLINEVSFSASRDAIELVNTRVRTCRARNAPITLASHGKDGPCRAWDCATHPQVKLVRVARALRILPEGAILHVCSFFAVHACNVDRTRRDPVDDLPRDACIFWEPK